MTGAKRSGFTLVELLVVVALFGMGAVILSQTFVSFNRLHRKVANSAVLAQEMRYAMEFMVREARNKPFDYASYISAADVASSTVLALKPPSGVETITRKSAAECGDPTVTSCLALWDGATWTPLTSKRVSVKFFGVYNRPTSSPFVPVSGAYSSDAMPMTTIALELEYLAPNPRDAVTLFAQTTVSSRVYQR